MALTRTDTALLLESTTDFFWNELVDHGDGIIVPQADDTDPQADDGSDGYVPLVADDGQVWRWKNVDETIGALTVQHDITLSPNQSETTAESIAIELAGTTYDVSIEVVDDGSGNDIPILVVTQSSALTLEVSDAVSFSDAPAKEAQAAKTDSFTAADAKVVSAGKVLADAFAVSEALAKSPGKVLSETFSVGDAFAGAIVIVLEVSDAFAVGDARAFSIGKVATETVSVGDAFAGVATYARSFSDAVTAADAASTSLSGSGAVSLGPVVGSFVASSIEANFQGGGGVNVTLA